MSNTNNNTKKLSYAKPIVLLCPIQMKILVSPSTASFQSSIAMSPVVVSPRNNNEHQTIDNQQVQQPKLFYEKDADTTITDNNISKDISYQTPIQKTPTVPINNIETTTTTQYSPSMNSYPTTSSLSTNSKSVQYSPVTPKQPQYTTPASNAEDSIDTTPSCIHQDFTSPSFSCEDISPIFFDFRKVYSTTPSEVTSSILPPVPPVSELKDDGSDGSSNVMYGGMPVCQEVTSTLNGASSSSYYPPPTYQIHGKENIISKAKISPDYIQSQSFTPPCHPCPPASSSRRYRRKCEVHSCPNRVVQGGVCISHGAKRKLCGFPGCTKHVKKAGMCSKHGPPRKRCDLEGCNKVAVQGGRCIAHGARKRICSNVGCNMQVFSFGLCKKHRMEEE